MAEIQATGDLILTTAEMQTNRWYYEQERLRRFPAFALIRPNGQVISAEGAIDTQNGNTYGIRLTLDGFPYALPKVFPKGWTPHPSAPHKYLDGSLCIMRSDQWRQYFTVALVVAKTAIWLGKYEIWKRNGHLWPGLGQAH
jgi:hypothetical protein